MGELASRADLQTVLAKAHELIKVDPSIDPLALVVAGVSVRGAARKTGVPPMTVSRRARAAGIDVKAIRRAKTRARADEIRALAAQGLRGKQIAKKLHISRSLVSLRLNETPSQPRCSQLR